MTNIFILITALILGLRHGIDWDHIAAITDLSGSTDNKRQSIINGMTYALGHAAVIISLGFLAILLGVQLPNWVDSVMEPVVGVTLIGLGIWLLGSILIHGKNFKLMSRWMMLFHLHHKLSSHHHSESTYDQFSKRRAFLVGMVHGVGAETPTQLLLFVTAAGIGGSTVGMLLVLAFVVGLLISNFLITMLAVFGFNKLQKNPAIYLGLGTISGVFSLIVGIIFLTGQATILPAILGG